MAPLSSIKPLAVTVTLVPLLLATITIQAWGSTSDGEADGNKVENHAERTPVPNDKQTPAAGDANDWTVAIYPVLAWAPIFGASVNFPNAPSLPGGGTSISGSGTTDVSLNGAAFAGVSVQKHKWIFDVNALWAGLSAERTSPRVYISTHAVYGDLLIGRQIYHHLALTVSVRRMALNIHAGLGNRPEVHWKPGVWDPMVGIDWRKALGRNWAFRVALVGGGFGAGNEVDLSGSSRADWRFTRHFGLTMGYGALHFQNSTKVLNQNYTTKQTLHGPIFGFGIYL